MKSNLLSIMVVVFISCQHSTIEDNKLSKKIESSLNTAVKQYKLMNIALAVRANEYQTADTAHPERLPRIRFAKDRWLENGTIRPKSAGSSAMHGGIVRRNGFPTWARRPRCSDARPSGFDRPRRDCAHGPAHWRYLFFSDFHSFWPSALAKAQMAQALQFPQSGFLASV